MTFAGTTLFIVTAIVALIGALITVAARRPLRAAVGLLVHIVALAGLYLSLHAELLATLQLLVYAGAVVVLFVFVIMLIGPASEVKRRSSGALARAFGLVFVLGFTLSIGGALSNVGLEFSRVGAGYGSVESFGRALYQGALLPFELVSFTLLVAIVGAVAIAKSRSPKESEALRAEEASAE